SALLIGSLREGNPAKTWLVLSVFLKEIEVIEHADHDLGVSEILSQAFVRDVVDGFSTGFTNGGKVLRLERGDRAGLEGAMVGDAVDGLAIGNRLGKLLLGNFFLAHLLIEGCTLGGHDSIKFLLRMGK